jgi:hypothetical protein
VQIADEPDPEGLVPVSVALAIRSDPAVLERSRLTGIFVIALALGAIAIRQSFLAGGMPTRSPGIRVLDAALLALLLAASYLVLERALAFAAPG